MLGVINTENRAQRLSVEPLRADDIMVIGGCSGDDGGYGRSPIDRRERVTGSFVDAAFLQ